MFQLVRVSFRYDQYPKGWHLAQALDLSPTNWNAYQSRLHLLCDCLPPEERGDYDTDGQFIWAIWAIKSRAGVGKLCPAGQKLYTDAQMLHTMRGES